MPSRPTNKRASDREQTGVRLARERVQALGVATGDAHVLRTASSVLVGFPTAELVARVDLPGRSERVRNHVRVALALEERGVAAVRTVDTPQSVVADPKGVVSLWELVKFEDRPATPQELGRIARSLHDRTRGGHDPLPVFDPFDGVDDWLQRVTVLDSPRAGELTSRVSGLRERWSNRSTDPLGEVILHGDLNLDNVVVTDSGPVLLDFESSGVGPAGWDLAAQWVAVRRYGGQMSEYEQFASAYGADIRDNSSCELYVDVYEATLVVWCLAHAGISPIMASEAELRVASLLDSTDARWTLR